MFKLNIPPGINLRAASVPHVSDNVKIILGSDERIYDKTYVTGIMNERLVKFLKESVQFKL